MTNIINHLLKEINRKAQEKKAKDTEYINTVTAVLENITGEFYNQYTNTTYDSYPTLVLINKKQEIKVERELRKPDMERTITALKAVIRNEKESEFLEWLTQKALPDFINQEFTKNFCVE